ncbi:MAG: TonB-dependent receptor [Deltaproteobacteria bacterium]|nr:TonB-dependent receptor [Deltaproteobacteria bacterium]
MYNRRPSTGLRSTQSTISKEVQSSKSTDTKHNKTRTNPVSLLLTLLLTLALLTPPLASAVDDFILDDIIVTALGTPEETEKIAADVTVITAKDIKESSATNVPALLRDVAGIIVQDIYGTGAKSVVDMRGFARGLNTAVLLDGRKLNEVDLSGVDWNLISIDNIERIEIVRGSGSVLYGDNAMAGVINIITKKKIAKGVRTNISLSSGSFGSDKESLTVSGSNEKSQYSVSARRSETNGFRDNSYFDSEDFDMRLSVTPNDGFYMDFSSGQHTDKQGLPSYLTKAEINDNRTQSTSPLDNVDYDQEYFNSVFGLVEDESILEGTYSLSRRAFDTDFVSSSGTINRETKTENIKIKYTTKNTENNGRNLLTMGFELNTSEARNVSDWGFGKTISEVEKTEEGYYINNELGLGDSLTIGAGYRHSKTVFENKVTGNINDGGRESFGEDSSRLGLTYNYADGSKFFINYSRGYRLPTTDELYDWTGLITTLNPERSNGFETGINQSFGKKGYVSLTLYDMNLKDELYYNPVTWANENLDDTRHRGAEFGFTLKAYDTFNIEGNYTYTIAKFESGPFEDMFIPLIPKKSANAKITFPLSESVTLSTRCNWVGKRFLDSDVDNSVDELRSATTIDAKISLKGKGYGLSFAAKNITDKEYSDYGVEGSTGTLAYYPSPGINYHGELRIFF